MKLAMWTSWQTRCGIAAYTAALVEELRGLGVEVDVVPVPYTDRDPDRRAAALVRLNAADLVHLQHEYTFWGGIAPGASSLPGWLRALRVPRVVTGHTVFSATELLRVDSEQRPRQRLAKRLLSAYPPYRRLVETGPFRGAAAVIVHTEAARTELAARGLPRERLHVLPAGVPPAAPAAPEAVAAWRERLGAEGRRLLTLFGYLSPDKGYEVALAALASLPRPVRLVIAGGTRVETERAYADTLQADILARGLAERVTITGYLEEPDLAAVLALTDLVLVPHTAANGSYSVRVALSHGKPVLASDLPCFREIAEQGGGVELFDAGDETMLVERAAFLLASPGTRRGLAEQAVRFAAAQSWRVVAERTLALYQTALSRPSGSDRPAG